MAFFAAKGAILRSTDPRVAGLGAAAAVPARRTRSFCAMASMVIDDDAAPLPREVSVGVQQIVPKIQRDLNCLADPDRQTRRKGLLRLEGSVGTQVGQAEQRVPAGGVGVAFTQHLQGPLLAVR